MRINISLSRELPKQSFPPNTGRNNVNDATNQPDPVEDIPVRGIGENSRLTDKVIGGDNTEYTAQPSAPAVPLKQNTTDDQQLGREQGNRAVHMGEKGNAVEPTQVFTYSNDESWQPKTEFERLFAPVGKEIASILNGTHPRQIKNRGGVPAELLLASESKSKSPSAKARSAMLKLIMPELSRDQGEQLAQAIKNHDGRTVEKILTSIGKKLGQVVDRKK